MELAFINLVSAKWAEYFPGRELPIAVFYSDTLQSAAYPEKPAPNPRGYTCLFAQMARIHRGEAVAFDPENLGCFGSMRSLYGGEYNEEATVNLLVNIEHFKKNRELTNAMNEVNPPAKPRGRYLILKPFNTLTEADNPEVIVFFGNPDMISALHTWASFDNTRLDNVIVPHGAGCECMFTFAFSEAGSETPRCVLGGMDTAMRGCLKPDQQTFSIPFKRFVQMMEFIDGTFLNTYIWKSLSKR